MYRVVTVHVILMVRYAKDALRGNNSNIPLQTLSQSTLLSVSHSPWLGDQRLNRPDSRFKRLQDILESLELKKLRPPSR